MLNRYHLNIALTGGRGPRVVHTFLVQVVRASRGRVAVGRNPTATPLGSVVVYMYMCKSWVAQLYSHAPTRPRHLLGG